MFREMIEKCAENFGQPPRRFSFWSRLTYLRVARPDWIYQNPDDGLETLFLNLSRLKRDGKVVWGHFIQANNQLFSPGPYDCPAEVVYSLTDPVGPGELSEVAAALGALKNTEPADPERAFIAHYLTNEMVRVHGKPVPKSISSPYACRISTTYIVRKHLPSGYISGPALPLIVSETEPHVVLPLPSRYWPKDLIEWWSKSY